MADQEGFRSALNGFNKNDVIEYIDAMQSRYSNEIRISQKQLSELQETHGEHSSQLNDKIIDLKEQLEALNKECDRLKGECTYIKQDNLRLKQKIESTPQYVADLRRLAQEVDILRIEKNTQYEQIVYLQSQLEQAKANGDSTDQIQQLKQQNEQLQLQLNEYQAKNNELLNQLESEDAKKLDTLANDAGNFIIEMYSLGQRFLEIAFKRSDNCLVEIEKSLKELTGRADEAFDQVKLARQELQEHGSFAGLRLDELMNTLECSADILSDDKSLSE